jgi:hypothetical protein
MDVTKLFTIQSCFKTDTFFLSISCRKRDDQAKRKNTADRRRESGRLRLHPFHRIRPLLKLHQKTNISRQRLQIRDLIAPNPTAVHLRQRSSTWANSTFTRRTSTQGRNRLHTWTTGCTREASMTGTRRTARWTSAGCAKSTSYYAVTTSAGGDHSDNKTAPGVSVGAQV